MIILPLLSLFIFSLTTVKVGFTNFKFIGFNNYSLLFTDADFLTSVFNTIVMLAGTVFLQMFLGTCFAILIYKSHFLTGFVRVVMMLPMVISPIIAGIIWRTLMMASFGGFDLMAATFGLPGMPDMLSDPWLAKLVVIFTATWEWTPFVVLYLLAGLESLPSSPFESAKIDGANWLQEIVYIVLPMLKKLLSVVAIFRIIEGMKVFPLIFALTQGGPGNATEDLTYLVYKNGFKYLKLGYSSAISMVILLIIIISIIALAVVQRKQAD
jgi:multiple sugar transport system permease protein